MSQYSQNTNASAAQSGRMGQGSRDSQRRTNEEEERKRWRRLTMVGSDDEYDSKESEGTATEFRKMWRRRQETRRISPQAAEDTYESDVEENDEAYREPSSATAHSQPGWLHDTDSEPEENDAPYGESSSARGPTDARSPPPEWMNSDLDDESDTYSDFFIPSPARRVPSYPVSSRASSASGEEEDSSITSYPFRPSLRDLISSLDGHADIVSDLQKTVAELRADLKNRNNAVRRLFEETLSALSIEVRLLREGREKDIQIAIPKAEIEGRKRGNKEKRIFEEIDELIESGGEEFVDALEIDDSDMEREVEEVVNEEAAEVQLEQGPRTIIVCEEILKLIGSVWCCRISIAFLWLLKAYSFGQLYWWSLCLLATFAPEF